MSDYRVATGHDVVLGSLTVLDPQPRSTGIQVLERSYAASAAVVDQGIYTEFIWDVLETDVKYRSILADFGLSASVRFADVTVYLRNQVWEYVRYNGVAVRPLQGQQARWELPFPRDIKILVRNLEPSA